MPALNAKNLKVTMVLDSAEVLTVSTPDGGPARLVLEIRTPDRVVRAEVAAKSVRKVKATIRELGADGVAVVLQGKLVAGDAIADAGISAMPKTPKPEAAVAA
jgi:hypothetical protein